MNRGIGGGKPPVMMSGGPGQQHQPGQQPQPSHLHGPQQQAPPNVMINPTTGMIPGPHGAPLQQMTVGGMQSGPGHQGPGHQGPAGHAHGLQGHMMTGGTSQHGTVPAHPTINPMMPHPPPGIPSSSHPHPHHGPQGHHQQHQAPQSHVPHIQPQQSHHGPQMPMHPAHGHGFPGPMPAPPPPPPPQLSAQAINQPITVLAKFGAEYVQEIVARTLEMFQLLRVMGTNNLQQQEDKRNKMRELTRVIEAYFQRLRKIYERCDQVYVHYEYGGGFNTNEVLESIIPLVDCSDDDEDEDGEAIEAEEQSEVCHLLTSEKGDLIEDSKEGILPPKPTRDGSTTPITPSIMPPEHQPNSLATEILAKINTDERAKNNPKVQALEREYQDLLELNQLRSRQMKEIIDRLRKLVWDINTMMAMRKP